jgi:L-ascorbate metabolism protein UlaG (beta-lactamase superfamily)
LGELNLDVSVSSPPASDHFDGERYYNPTLAKGFVPSISSVFKLLLDKRSKWPTSVINTAVPRLNEKLAVHDIAVTFVNHATFLIQFDGMNLLTDPVWSRRVSPFSWLGPARVRKPGIPFDGLPNIGLILLTHNHYDHLDVQTLERLNQRFAPTVLVATGNKKLLRSIGFEDVHELDWWDEIEINSALKITFAPTQHFSGRSLRDRQKSLWGSYMLHYRNRLIYFGGDSGYSSHFSEIRLRLGLPDLSFLGIGAYAPRWFMKAMHMNPEEAVRAHQDLGSRQSVGMHFGTFQLSSEAIDQPHIDLKTALANAHIPEAKFVTLGEGETRIY